MPLFGFSDSWADRGQKILMGKEIAQKQHQSIHYAPFFPENASFFSLFASILLWINRDVNLQ